MKITSWLYVMQWNVEMVEKWHCVEFIFIFGNDIEVDNISTSRDGNISEFKKKVAAISFSFKKIMLFGLLL